MSVNFNYKAVDGSGRMVESTHQANTKEEVLKMLRDKGFTPVNIQQEEQVSKDVGEIALFEPRVKTKEIAIFCKQLHTMLNAGMPLSNSLDVLCDQTEHKVLRRTLKEVYSDVQTGLVLSQGMRKHTKVFPKLLITMVEAGEMTGNLDSVLAKMSEHYDKENKINSKIKGAMVYPIILSAMAVGSVVFLLTFIMPVFVGMFSESGVALPGPTRLLMNISNLLRTRWYIFVGVIVGGSYIIKKYGETLAGKRQFDALKLKIPVVGSSVRKIATSRFTRTLSTLMASGIPIVPAMNAAASVTNNQIVIDGMENVIEEVKKGLSISFMLKSMNFFPPMVISMVTIGEESGSLETMLSKSADYYDEELDAAIQKMLSMLEPILILVMGGMIGFIVVSMMLPIFDLTKTVQ